MNNNDDIMRSFMHFQSSIRCELWWGHSRVWDALRTRYTLPHWDNDRNSPRTPFDASAAESNRIQGSTPSFSLAQNLIPSALTATNSWSCARHLRNQSIIHHPRAPSHAPMTAHSRIGNPSQLGSWRFAKIPLCNRVHAAAWAIEKAEHGMKAPRTERWNPYLCGWLVSHS